MAKMKLEIEQEDDYEAKGGYGKCAKPIRAQVPFETTGNMQGWTPGTPPIGGFRSVINFGAADNKMSPTTRGVTPFQAPGLKGKNPRGY